jgi:hypothetical protein
MQVVVDAATERGVRNAVQGQQQAGQESKAGQQANEDAMTPGADRARMARQGILRTVSANGDGSFLPITRGRAIRMPALALFFIYLK